MARGEGVLRVVPILLGVARMTLVERKGMGAVQRRRGPNVVGVYGRRTPFADGRKLRLKEVVVPLAADRGRYLRAPRRTFARARRGWAVLPGGEGRVYGPVAIGVRVRRRCSGRGVYGIVLAGWASNSKYARRGGLRTAAQIISYERTRGTAIAVLMALAGSGNREVLGRSQRLWGTGFGLLPRAVLFYVGSMAERNRHPFDLPEAEAELVSGYNVEYAAITFTLFFLGEYGNMRRIAGRTAWRFCSRLAWVHHGLAVRMRLLGYVLARAGYPRYRYDQLRRRGWKVHRPFVRGFLVVEASRVGSRGK